MIPLLETKKTQERRAAAALEPGHRVAQPLETISTRLQEVEARLTAQLSPMQSDLNQFGSGRIRDILADVGHLKWDLAELKHGLYFII